jgi:hypothetical protein
MNVICGMWEMAVKGLRRWVRNEAGRAWENGYEGKADGVGVRSWDGIEFDRWVWSYGCFVTDMKTDWRCQSIKQSYGGAITYFETLKFAVFFRVH